MTRYSMVLLAVLAMAVGCGESSAPSKASAPSTPSSPNTPPTPSGSVYSTNFPLTENPLSEGGNWINGLQTGLDWLDIRTTPGFAFGTRVGGGGANFTDSTAVLTGTWGQNQTVEVTTVVNTGGCCKEIELRLNSTMMAHSSAGYEILFEVTGTISTVRWDGAIGSFEFIAGPQNLSRALQTGDVLKASRVGNVITVYFNGVPVQQVTDATYLAGSPGIGLNNYAPATTPSDFGISSLTASD